ncbi:SLC13 family permease [Acidobacteria bacterium AH-259-G07]|nr:SLC13 family permease [Acidobacteria bacterium AH-259-G07]
MRQKIGLISGPIIFFLVIWLPESSGLSGEGQTVLATAFLMALWWITEALPIAATALLPLAIFPLMRVAPVAEISGSYMDPNIVLFMGGFFLAMSIQKWNLHKRVALWIIYWMGTNLQRLVLGFMVATAFLSMWVSNTATAIMMLPIGTAVIMRLSESGLSRKSKFPVVLMLAIAYAASIGGVSTLIGTPPNIVFAAQFARLFPDRPDVSFAKWLTIGLPFTLLYLPLAWLYLTRIYSSVEKGSFQASRGIITQEIAKLGVMSRGEKATAFIFTLTALGWIFRKDLSIGTCVIPGWAPLLGVSNYVDDSTVAMISSLILFSTPVDWKNREFLLDWDWAKRIPWGILILFGGGIALAKGFQTSGLATWAATGLEWFHGVPVIVLIVLTSVILSFLTELTSNTATTTIFLPILAATASSFEVPPELLMIPATISASCAFMLPVATPPNAIVFASEYLTMPDMAKAGIWMNLLGVLITTLIVSVIGTQMFEFPFLSLF